MSTSVAQGFRAGADFRPTPAYLPGGDGRDSARVGRAGAAAAVDLELSGGSGRDPRRVVRTGTPAAVVLDREQVSTERDAGRGAAPAVARDARSDPHAPRFGHAGLQDTLAEFADRPESLPAILLTSLIHSMGGAPTSIARGAYLSFAV